MALYTVPLADGHLEVVKYLIEERGCDPKISMLMTELECITCVQLTAGHLDVVAYLIEDRESAILDMVICEYCWSKMHCTIWQLTVGHLDVVKYLGL